MSEVSTRLAAEILGCSPRTLLRWRDRAVPALWKGRGGWRWDREKVERLARMCSGVKASPGPFLPVGIPPPAELERLFVEASHDPAKPWGPRVWAGYVLRHRRCYGGRDPVLPLNAARAAKVMAIVKASEETR